MRSPRPASQRTAYVPKEEAGPQLARAQARCPEVFPEKWKPPVESTRSLWWRVFGISAELDFLFFLPPLFVKILSCECKIYIIYIYFKLCVAPSSFISNLMKK